MKDHLKFSLTILATPKSSIICTAVLGKERLRPEDFLVAKDGPLGFRVNRDFQSDLATFLSRFSRTYFDHSLGDFLSKTRAINIAVSGAFLPEEHRSVKSYLYNIGLPQRSQVKVQEDIHTILPAHGLDSGLALKVSSGSNCLAKAGTSEDLIHTMGGWGSELADYGGGYQLGLRALSFILDCTDYRRPADTPFIASLIKTIGLDSPFHIVPWFYELKETPYWRSKVSDLSIIIDIEAKNGNQTARNLIADSVSEILSTVKSMIIFCYRKSYFPKYDEIVCVCAGSLALKTSYYRRTLFNQLAAPSQKVNPYHDLKITFQPATSHSICGLIFDPFSTSAAGARLPEMKKLSHHVSHQLTKHSSTL